MSVKMWDIVSAHNIVHKPSGIIYKTVKKEQCVKYVGLTLHKKLILEQLTSDTCKYYEL